LQAYEQEHQKTALQTAPVLYAQANTPPRGLRGFSQPVQESFYSDYHPPQPQKRDAAPIYKHYHGEREQVQVTPVQPRTPQRPTAISVPQYRPSPQPIAPNSTVPAYRGTQGNTRRSTSVTEPIAKQLNPVGAAQTINSSEQSLRQSLGAAVQNSPRLAIEDLRIQEAQEALIQSQAQGKFKLNLNGVLGPTQSETEFSVVDSSTSDFRINRGANLNSCCPRGSHCPF